MLRNAYIGLWVLSASLYWLAGPDLTHRRARGKRAMAIAGCRARLQASGDMPNQADVQAELDVLEAEDAAAAAKFADERANFLQRLRKRSGLENSGLK